MPEDSGNKRMMKDFLQRIKGGEGLIEDIWIERDVRPLGTNDVLSDNRSLCSANSLSGRPVSNITELLQDDIRQTFEEGYFTARFVTALLGSGKTSLLTYLEELIINKPDDKKNYVVTRFGFNKLSAISSNYNFQVKFYCYILSKTFWGLTRNQESSVRDEAIEFLKDFDADERLLDKLNRERINQDSLEASFLRFFGSLGVDLAKLFLNLIFRINQVDSGFSFAYLIDELDSLKTSGNEIEDIQLILKDLLKRIYDEYQSKIPLLIYLVGTQNRVRQIIKGNSVLESLIAKNLISISMGLEKEHGIIRQKIDERFRGAYQGYKDFDVAWQEVESIPLKPTIESAKNLRAFCQYYGGEILKVHEKYFKEMPEQKFEGDARGLVEAKCRERWQKYLNKKAYTLSTVETTKVIPGRKTGKKHALDCYVELLHNGTQVARGFGEAKNYELLSSHLQIFSDWLDDFEFNSHPSDDTLPDLAFMIAPSCPSLLAKKLKSKNIEFIQADKELPPPTNQPTPAPEININISGEKEPPTPTPAPGVNTNISGEKEPPPPTPAPSKTGININTANESELRTAFRGSGVKKTTIQKLIKNRKGNPYRDLAHLVSDLKFTDNVKAKLQEKLDKGEISFSD
ncbi:MAG: hypothetical protein F6K40_04970 [Okeania sp. SIO3I5]|uniref:hypothetical protein n=1 Tax=Okeania sp. SIO3I5 TaxID=2607805 RepID=UPI0013B73B55|nr:hypothetical protein [Okeania sp. SIO3I5]NEQ35679.1 hypothetical protein [Okeania sp. SIO3I5]